MSRYCTNCKKEISKEDVFCGYCGTHQPNTSGEKKSSCETPNDNAKYCNNCKKEILKEDVFCGYCGTRQITTNSKAQQINNTSNEKITFSEMLSPNDKYYINVFTKLSNYYFVWNWSAFFFGMFWFAYRKMFLFIPIPYILCIFINILLTPFTSNSSTIIGTILISAILCGTFGNNIYKKHLENIHQRINSQNISYHNKLQLVKKKTGTSPQLTTILVSIILIFLGIITVSVINNIKIKENERKRNDINSTFDNIGQLQEGSSYIWDKNGYLWQIKEENQKYYVYKEKDDGTWSWFLLSTNFDINNPDIENNTLFEAVFPYKSPYEDTSTNTLITAENFEEKVPIHKKTNSYDKDLFKRFFDDTFGINSTCTYKYIGTTNHEDFSLPEYNFYNCDVYRVDYPNGYKIYYLIPYNIFESPKTIYVFTKNTETQKYEMFLVWTKE